MRKIIIALALCLMTSALSAQTVGLPAYFNIQFIDNNGNPLIGGSVFTYQAGTTTPAVTYTDAAMMTENANPIVLNAAGRPSVGSSTVGIFLSNTTSYRFLVLDSGGVTILDQDNVTTGGGSGGGGGGGGSWTITGNDQYNSNPGFVGIGTSAPLAQLGVVGDIDVKGRLFLRNSEATPRTVSLVPVNGMAASYALTFPPSLPASTSCFTVSNIGVMNFDSTCLSGGGSGAGNTPFPFTATTTVAMAHNLNTVDILVACYDNSSPKKYITLDADYPKITNANNATATWTGSKTGYCVVNSSAGNPNIWSRDSDSNITLSDSGTAISSLKFKNQTASTGATVVTWTAGAGQLGSAFWVFGRDGVANLDGYMTMDSGDRFFQFPQFGVGIDATVAPVARLSALGGGTLSLASTGSIQFSSDATDYGTKDLCELRESSGLLKLDDCSGNARDLHIRNLTIDGTCTGSSCLGGGGGAPFSDTSALVYRNGDATTQLRFDLVNQTAGTFHALKPQNANYTIAGLETAQTFTANQSIDATLRFLQSGSLQWQMVTDVTNILNWRNASSVSRMALWDTGASPIAGTGATLVAPSVLAQSKAVNTPSLSVQQIGSQTSNIFEVQTATPTSTSSYLSVNFLGFTSVQGTSSGANYPLWVTGTGVSTGVTFYTGGLAAATKTGSISSGATSALSVQDNADAFRFIVFQTGDVQIGSSTDQGSKFYVNGGALGSQFVNSSGITTLGVSNAGTGVGVAISTQSTTSAALAIDTVARTTAVAFLNSACGVYAGSGSPEGAVTAPQCSMYLRSGGGAGTSLYIKESGSGSVGWAAK